MNFSVRNHRFLVFICNFTRHFIQIDNGNREREIKNNINALQMELRITNIRTEKGS